MLDSFSQDAKNEICAAKNKLKCCRASELYGMMFGASVFEKNHIALDTENPVVLIRYAKLIREFLKVKGSSDAELLDIASPMLISALFSSIGLLSGVSLDKIQNNVMQCQFCGWSFVRGVFLSCGTVTAPGNAYHLEFLMRNETSAFSFLSFLESLGVFPRITERGEKMRGIYFKDSEEIVDILGHIGANRAAFELLNVKIYKDIRNNVNRVSNCELANIGKTVAASNEQMKAIETIIQSGKADELPDELRATLDIRAAFPNATLSELAEKHTPPITKSGVNHRLKRLIDFSKKC